MQLDSTSGYSISSTRMLAALAATCFVSTAPVHAETIGRPIGEFQRFPTGKAIWGSTSRAEEELSGDGELIVYVDDDAESPVAREATRSTSEQEHLIAQLRTWEGLGANWDGEGASAPQLTSVRAASKFVCLLDRSSTMPEPMLHASGRAGLLWDDGATYAELEFLESGLVAYYITAKANKHKGVFEFDGRVIPEALSLLIPA